MAKTNTELGKLIAKSREDKGISQRQLAKLASMDSAEVSRIENGKRQKPNVLYLKGIAEVLDLSLVKLMEMAGYNDIDINWGRNRSENRSTEDYRKTLQEYERFYFDVLDDSKTKKDIVRSCKSQISDIIDRIDNPQFYQNKKISLEDISSLLKKINRELQPSAEKYDYKNLPKTNLSSSDIKD